ncbi:MAG: hypothetical protein PHE73_05860 [Sulfurovaceae bacterium]|nr:hypothetical protein [Sulfurovaceae bacterium]
MRLILIVLVFLSVIGCKGKISDNTNKSSSERQYTQAQLQNAKPISNQQFKELTSQRIDDFSKEQISMGYSGLYSAEISYANDDKRILISIVDGAGKDGSNLIALMKQSVDSNIDIKNQNGYIKSTSIDGIRAVKEEIKSKNNIVNKLTLIISDRFLLTIVGTNVDMDKLEDIVKKEDLISKLQNLAR